MCVCVFWEGIARRIRVQDNSRSYSLVPTGAGSHLLWALTVWEWRVSMGTSVEVTKRTLWQLAMRESGNQGKPRVTDSCVLNEWEMVSWGRGARLLCWHWGMQRRPPARLRHCTAMPRSIARNLWIKRDLDWIYLSTCKPRWIILSREGENVIT